MKDMIPKGTGNSRYLRSVSNFKAIYPTYDDFVNALVAGNLPVDFNGINEAGIQQVGTSLNKANLLADETAVALGLRHENPTVNDAFENLSIPKSGTGTLYVYCKDEAGEPVSGCVIQIGEELAVTGAIGAVKYFLVPGTYSVAIRSPIDYGAEVQTVSVTVALSESTHIEVTIQDSLYGETELDITSAMVAAFSGRVTSADVFGVGGGGSGGAISYRPSYNGQAAAAAGGAGGKTVTANIRDLSKAMNIFVGSGGVAKTAKSGGSTSSVTGGTGGTTEVETVSGSQIISAPGGSGGETVTGIAETTSHVVTINGASGGSGSGAVRITRGASYVGASGVDGADGGDVTGASGGSGQGSTTRAFGDPGGEAFSPAGGSVGISYYSAPYIGVGEVGEGGGAGAVGGPNDGNQTATPGTTPGAGGGGAAIYAYSTTGLVATSGAGANGLVRFRWEVAA